MSQSERLKKKFLNHLTGLAAHWAEAKDLTPIERTSGVVFSILATLDGASAGIPMMDLVPVNEDENEPAEMYDLVLVGTGVDFQNTEQLLPDTKIKAGSLHDAFVNLRKEAAEQIAESEGE